MDILRAVENPLITPDGIVPSSPDMKVVCAFNAATARHEGDTLLLIRVAESIKDERPDEIAVPILECDNGFSRVRIERIPIDEPGLDLSDSRAISLPGKLLLTSLSHFRLARSKDGIHFDIDPHPTIFPSVPYEEYGIEDPRITQIGDTYYINYTAVSRWGISVGLISTRDFNEFTRHGLIFGPENKNVAIFPRAIDGLFYAMHRPATTGLGTPQMWMASSPDLLHWGDHQPLMAPRLGMWDEVRIGAGNVPIETEDGWLAIYHGVNRDEGYCLGALLLDIDNPRKVLARSVKPILFPHAKYETDGFYGNVVFTCGTILDDDGLLYIYYGAADEHTCCATVPLQAVMDSLACPLMVNMGY